MLGVEALREEMRRDESIVYIGQGIGPRGGNFRQTRGLWKEFGDHRLRDTGICELGATGVAIGAAMAGTRTIVDEVFLDFALEAITQIVQQAANISYMSNGKIKAPVLIRGAMGAVRSAGAHHSHTFYNWFANTPGLKVVLPATPYDVKGLFKTALREPGPVVFIEHKSLYNTKGIVPEEEYLIPLGDAHTVREGQDLTIIAMSRMVDLAVKAADLLAEQGISAEVIDPRSIVSTGPQKDHGIHQENWATYGHRRVPIILQFCCGASGYCSRGLFRRDARHARSEFVRYQFRIHSVRFSKIK